MAFSAVSNKSSKPSFLHIREMAAKTGKPRRLFYFPGDLKGAAPSMPEGCTVVKNERTGLPFLKKKA